MGSMYEANQSVHKDNMVHMCACACAVCVVWDGGVTVERMKSVQETMGGYLAVKVNRKMGAGPTWIGAEGKIF